MNTSRVRFVGLAALLVLACKETGPTALPEPPLVVFPDAPISMEPGTQMSVFVKSSQGWVSPERQKGFFCSTTNRSVLDVSDNLCDVVAVGTEGSTAFIVVQTRTQTESISVTIKAQISIPMPELQGAIPYWSALSSPTLSYLTAFDLNLEQVVVRVNPETREVTPVLRRPGQTAGAVAVNSAGTVAYIAGGGKVIRLNTQNDAPIDSIIGLTSPVYSMILTPDDSTLFIGADNHLFVVSLSAGAIVSDIPMPGRVLYMSLSPTRPQLFASVLPNSGSATHALVEVSTASNTVTRVFGDTLGPRGTAVTRDGVTLLLATDLKGLWTCGVAVDTTCRAASAGFGLDAVLSIDGSRLFLAWGTSNQLLVYDTQPPNLRHIVVLRGLPERLAVRAGTGFIAVSSDGIGMQLVTPP